MTDTRNYGVGRVFQHPRSPFWFASWYVDGKEHRRSTGVAYKKGDLKTGRRNAERELERLKKEAVDSAVASENAVTYLQLREGLIADYKKKQRRSLESLQASPLKHLDRHFEKMTIDKITTEEVEAYLKKRERQGAAHATRNNEMAALRRMLKLGVRAGKKAPNKITASQVPDIEITAPNNARKNFVEPEEFGKIVLALPAHIKPLAMFLYATSWRSGEAKSLQWTDVDFSEGVVSIDGERTKNSDGRIFPFAEVDLAKEALELAWARRKTALESAGVPLDGLASAWPFVFCDHLGRPIGSFRKSWKTACKKAEVRTPLGKPPIVHDLRRSAVRNMMAAGLDEASAMAISGHRTREIFQRYNIKDRKNLLNSSAKIGAFLRRRLAAQPSTGNGAPSTDRPQTSGNNTETTESPDRKVA